MSFEKNKYLVIPEAIPKIIAKFVCDYFLLKREAFSTLTKHNIIKENDTQWGVWGDGQVVDTYCHYGDVAMETLLAWVLPVMVKETGLDLDPTYSYARIYKKGDELKRHKDRFSCEISTTINLGSDKPWPIYLDPTGNKGGEGVRIKLQPGDMLIYRGCDLEHWRKPFDGQDCVQVFLHYNEKKSLPEGVRFDTRPHIGLPDYMKQQ
jgi:hypothetical protein|tara:strand:- start:499 stop:1119 length:621 start_codon:yes stop_codon:yes gene_type:complete